MLSSGTHDVIVVGAGAAGLTAATVLHEAGHRILCPGARTRVGGRLLSEPVDGGALDLGATWFWPGERRVAAQAAGVSEGDGFIATHVRHTVDLLMDRSQELADRVASGRTAVVGLTYRLSEGSVRTVASRGLGLPPDGTAASAVASTSTVR